MQFPDSAFWDFSIGFYARTEVESICLELQNRYELNVNLVLLALWLSAHKHIILSAEQWQQLVAIASPWQEIILPLRKSRQFIRDTVIAWSAEFQAEIAASISEIELNAEHMQQLALEKTFEEFNAEKSEQPALEKVTGNISNYLQALNSETSIETLKDFISKLVNTLDDKPQENKKISA